MAATMNKKDVIYPPEGKVIKPSQIKPDLSNIMKPMMARLGSDKMFDRAKALKLMETAKTLERKNPKIAYYVKVGRVGDNLLLRVKEKKLLGGHVGDVILVKGYKAAAKKYAEYAAAEVLFTTFRAEITVTKMWKGTGCAAGWKKEVQRFFKKKYMPEPITFLLAYEAKSPTSDAEKKAFYERFIKAGAPDQITGGAGTMSGIIAEIMKAGAAENYASMNFKKMYDQQLLAIHEQEQISPWLKSDEFAALAAKLEPTLKGLKNKPS